MECDIFQMPYLRRMIPETIQHKRILISPLNWGMGHVSRCIPLIDRLLRQNNSVIIAGDASQLVIFEQYFPGLEMVIHEGYPFRFGEKGNFAFDLAARFLALNKRLKQELVETEELVKKHGIEVVISDHRYGFRSKKVPSFIVCHQLNLPVRKLESWVQRIHHNLLRNFNAIWVPDFADSRMAGDLSQNKAQMNAQFIGPLSRFERYTEKPNKDIDEVIVISGPSVYGEHFLRQIVSNRKIKRAVLIASPDLTEQFSRQIAERKEIEIHSSADWLACDQLILRAKKLVSRSGYSTLMDIHELGIPYELSATPGQREQEYLLGLWNK
jgi:hypothetical protein